MIKINWRLYWLINAVVFPMVLLAVFVGKLNMNSMIIFSCVMAIGAANVYDVIHKAKRKKEQEKNLSPWK